MARTKEELENAVRDSTSIREALRKLNLKPAGGNYKSFKNQCGLFNIDISHFKKHGHTKDRVFGPKKPLEYYLNTETNISSYHLKNRLISEKVFDRICFRCERSEWLGFSIPLELDHIDGNNRNNKLDNLRLLCPNCHALTDTYRGKNIGKQARVV